MPPEKAYEEAQHRIREAESTEALELDLSELALKRLPPELGRLSSLQTLNLSKCEQLTDLSPLAALTSLQTLCAKHPDVLPNFISTQCHLR